MCKVEETLLHQFKSINSKTGPLISQPKVDPELVDLKADFYRKEVQRQAQELAMADRRIVDMQNCVKRHRVALGEMAGVATQYPGSGDQRKSSQINDVSVQLNNVLENAQESLRDLVDENSHIESLEHHIAQSPEFKRWLKRESQTSTDEA